MNPGPLLELAGIRAGYGPIEVLHGVDLVLDPGAVVALLGPQRGGGKTTTLKVCAGIQQRRRGEFRLAGRAVNGVSAADLARLGGLLDSGRPRRLPPPT